MVILVGENYQKKKKKKKKRKTSFSGLSASKQGYTVTINLKYIQYSKEG